MLKRRLLPNVLKLSTEREGLGSTGILDTEPEA